MKSKRVIKKQIESYKEAEEHFKKLDNYGVAGMFREWISALKWVLD